MNKRFEGSARLARAAHSAIVTACLLLASCGGETGSSPPSGGTPTPSPSSSTPTPSPTPSSTGYSAFNQLTGSREFNAGCGNLFGTGGNTSTEGFGSYPGNPEALAHKYDAASEGWQIEGYARDDSNGPKYTYQFGPADLQPGWNNMSILYGKTETDGFGTRYSIMQPMLGASAAQYARETRLVARPGTNEIDIHCVIGVETQQADSLPSGDFAYNSSAVAGTATSSTAEYDLGESTANWSGNGTSLQFTMTLNLKGRQITPSGLSPTVINLGNYQTSYGWLHPPSKYFSGALFLKDGVIAGSFGGAFFGPQGTEMGYGFSGYGSESGINFQFGGTVLARR